MRRKRHQRGSLQRLKQGSCFMWVVKYYDMDGRRRQTTLGQPARMTKAEAQVERERFMATINEDAAERLARRDPPMLASSSSAPTFRSNGAGGSSRPPLPPKTESDDTS